MPRPSRMPLDRVSLSLRKPFQARASSLTPFKTDSMQRLQVLESQQEVLRRRLALQVPAAAPMTAGSPELNSLSSSPVSSRSAFASSWSPELEYTSAHPMPIMGHRHSIDDTHVEDSHKLYEINQQIKATLTELLNTESVRSDDKYRAWIQERLMDAERQIRKQRRRHSSGDRMMAASIATHMSPTAFSPPMHWR